LAILALKNWTSTNLYYSKTFYDAFSNYFFYYYAMIAPH